jgi:hypothetical protein
MLCQNSGFSYLVFFKFTFATCDRSEKRVENSALDTAGLEPEAFNTEANYFIRKVSHLGSAVLREPWQS